jgi:phosphotransferase system  glucose/maltose/N-acetylglucosamine-specific IIC component
MLNIVIEQNIGFFHIYGRLKRIVLQHGIHHIILYFHKGTLGGFKDVVNTWTLYVISRLNSCVN